MARARNIKPNFFKNYDLADLGMAAQLLFAGLWCLADKEGRLEDKPRLIKAEIFPYYDVDVNGELTKLQRLGFLDRYKSQGIFVIEICNFKKHQSPHHTEKNSELPSKDRNCIENNELNNNGELPVNSQEQDGENPPDSLIPDSLIPDSIKHTRTSAPSESFEKFYAAYPKKKNRIDAEKAWKKLKPPIDDVLKALEWQKQSEQWTKNRGEYIPYPASYLNAGGWMDEPVESAPRKSKMDISDIDYKAGVNDDGSFL